MHRYREWIESAEDSRARRQIERMFEEIIELRNTMSEAMKILDPDAFPVNPASERICEMLLKRVNDLPEESDCDHEGEHHRIEMIEVSPLPWDHVDLMAFRLELVRATLVDGWFICRHQSAYWDWKRGLWHTRAYVQDHPENFAFKNVSDAVNCALGLIHNSRIGGIRWHELPPADSQFQEFADKLAALAARKG